jgi:hypothetical protein
MLNFTYAIIGLLLLGLFAVMIVKESFGKWRDADGKRIIPPGLTICIGLLAGVVTEKAYDLGEGGFAVTALVVIFALMSIRLAD